MAQHEHQVDVTSPSQLYGWANGAPVRLSVLPDGRLQITETSTLKERYDYDVRTDGQPVYVGTAASGLAENAVGWFIVKYSYNVDSTVSAKNVARESLTTNNTAAWTTRGSCTYE